MRITDAMVKKLGLPDTSRWPATSPTPATPRPPRSRWRWPGCSKTGEAKSGDLALLIGFGAGLVYSAQVVIAALAISRPPATAGTQNPTVRQASHNKEFPWRTSRRSSAASPRS